MNQQSQSQNDQQKNNDTESVFLISSAIHAKHGIYDTETRFKQTIETCKSIRERCDAKIIILDGGYQELTSEERHEITDYIDEFYTFSGEEIVQQIQNIPNHDIVKNMIEIVMYGSFYDKVCQEGWRDKYKRIFKMSGRYTLNDTFNYQKHMDAKDKIIIRGPFTSQFNSDTTGGVSLQYMSRLWSFDAFLLPYIRDIYVDMFRNMNNRLAQKGYIDIEHLLFHHLDLALIENIGKLGLDGNIAPNGVRISD
jgi:hypothetical protein